MKLKTLFIITAVITLVFGVGFLLFPEQAVSSYGVTLGEPGKWVGRYLGSAFVGLSVLTWSARNATQGDGLRAIVLGFFVLSVTGVIVAVMDTLYGEGNNLIWLNVAIYLFLSVGYGYFQFVKPASS
jgi:hypothetical protein